MSKYVDNMDDVKEAIAALDDLSSKLTFGDLFTDTGDKTGDFTTGTIRLVNAARFIDLAEMQLRELVIEEKQNGACTGNN